MRNIVCKGKVSDGANLYNPSQYHHAPEKHTSRIPRIEKRINNQSESKIPSSRPTNPRVISLYRF